MLALPLAPAATILLLTVGLCLVFVEFNRPGLILPGALGLTALLLAIASILAMPSATSAIDSPAAAIAAFALNYRRPRPWLAAIAAGLLGVAFLSIGAASPAPVLDRLLAVFCALTLALLTYRLSRIARRARINKRSARRR